MSIEIAKSLKEIVLQKVANRELTAGNAKEYIDFVDRKVKHTQSNVAIIGYDCRLPGADSPLKFWDNLLEERDSVSSFPKKRMDDVLYINDKTYREFKGLGCRVGGYLDEVDKFDYRFFNINPLEARDIDPGQRKFLEVAVGALQHAGLTKKSLDGSNTGVYIGHSVNEDFFADLLGKENPNLALGNQPALLPSRLSFMFNLLGPAMVIDTTCSSSLVAVDTAVKAIQNGYCDQAIVAGVNIRIFPAIREVSNLGIEAFDGRCKTFDERANGTNIGEGVVAIVLKREELADQDQDSVHAVIRGSSVGHDGTSNGLTAPNASAQASVIKDALSQSGISAGEIDFIETHGTGTKLGDPIEVHGLSLAFNERRKDDGKIFLGAVKTNIGHLEATAGIAGLLKCILCLKYSTLPKNIHFKNPNPYIDFAASPFAVAKDQVALKNHSLISCGVSSFGISGTNAHVILQQKRHDVENNEVDGKHIILVSAENSESLLGNLIGLKGFIRNENEGYSLAEISHTLCNRRDHYRYRMVIISKTLSELQKKLNETIEGMRNGNINTLVNELIFYTDSDINTFYELDSEKLLEGIDASLVDIYLSGESISLLNEQDNLRVVPLPSYSFRATRCWPLLGIDKEKEQRERFEKLFHNVSWIENNLSHDNDRKLVGNCLYLSTSSASNDKLQSILEKKGMQLIKVLPGDAFAKHDSRYYVIRLDDPQDYRRLFNSVIEDFSHIIGIVHALNWDKGELDFTCSEAILKGQYYGAFSSYYLIRAWQEVFKNQRMKYVSLSSPAHRILPKDDLDPSKATALGVNKVASQENPKITSIFIDADSHEDSLQAVAAEITAEPFSDHIIGYRNGQRYKQVLERMDLDNPKERSEDLICEGDTFIIAGGAGYLGLETAKHLATKAKVNIILCGRKDLSFINDHKEVHPSQMHTELLEKVSKIKNLGSTITYIHGDVTTPDGCASVVAQTRERFGQVSGIFLAIKNISHKRIDEVADHEFKENILAKLNSVYYLSKFTEDFSLKLFVTFSSISSLTGGPTGADCSASNLFLDSYGDYGNYTLGRTTLTLNYTLINADDGSLDSDRMSMIPPLSREECMQCLDLLLTRDINFAVMADFEPRVMKMVLPYIKINFSQELLTTFSDDSSTKTRLKLIQVDEQQSAKVVNENIAEGTISASDVTVIVKQIWVDVLGHNDFSETTNFFDAGGDSISAVKMMDSLHKKFPTKLEVATLYSHPCISELSVYILENCYGAVEPDEKLVFDKKRDKKNEEKDLSALLAKIDNNTLSIEEASNRI